MRRRHTIDPCTIYKLGEICTKTSPLLHITLVLRYLLQANELLTSLFDHRTIHKDTRCWLSIPPCPSHLLNEVDVGGGKPTVPSPPDILIIHPCTDRPRANQ